MFILIYTCFTVIFLCQSVSADLTQSQTAACDEVFNPYALTYSCCSTMDQFVATQNKCLASSSIFNIFTCAVSTCVVRDVYQLTDSVGNIDENKVNAFLAQLDSQQPETIYTNQLIRANCLNYGYRRYVTSDPYCDTMMFEVCSFVNSLFGCPQFKTTPSACPQLAYNAQICRPVVYQYLSETRVLGIPF